MSGVHKSKKPTWARKIRESFKEELEVEQELSGWGGFERVKRWRIGYSK